MLPKDGGSRVGGPAPDDCEFKPECCCLFVANLPRDLSNSELAYALFEAFRAMFGAAYSGPPGAMRSIKASRDSRMRPFGFVTFDSARTAKAMLECTRRLLIWMSGRRLRIEPAKRQHRLRIRVLLQESTDVFCEHARIYQELYRTVSPHNIRVLPLQSGYDGVHLVYVVKLDPPNEELVLSWSLRGWQVQPITDGNLSNDDGSLSTRNSGLVQLVIPDDWQDSCFYNHPLATTSTPSACPDMQTSSNLASCSEPSVAAHGSAPGDIYVGRLNSRRVTTGELAERFGVYGRLAYVRLYNRLAVGLDGIPIDSHALIRFHEAGAAESAIKGQNRATWHGQTIKCEKARPVLAPDNSWRVVEGAADVD